MAQGLLLSPSSLGSCFLLFGHQGVGIGGSRFKFPCGAIDIHVDCDVTIELKRKLAQE
jgi:hypothetical protein